MTESVPIDLLNVRISHISFESDGQPIQWISFTPDLALEHILLAPEIVAFMKNQDMELLRFPAGVPGNLFGRWPLESPHISGSMDNVTLSEALDRALQTFPGLWAYWDCRHSNNKKRVYFRFFRLNKGGGDRVIG
jgi:hypothetical protein